MRLWVAGQVINDAPIDRGTMRWELQGVFSSEQEAVAACRDATYFVGPVTLDESLPEECMDWPGAYYPLAFRQPKGSPIGRTAKT